MLLATGMNTLLGAGYYAMCFDVDISFTPHTTWWERYTKLWEG